MCGIVGSASGADVVPLLLRGLEKLEYRGYDSAGVAVQSKGRTEVVKRVGRVAALRSAVGDQVHGETGIGHTRWATHGPATVQNAHPQRSECGDVVLVHNGMIDNADDLRDELVALGVTFASETDTEVLAHLISRSTAPTLEGLVRDALSQIRGSYAIAVMSERFPGQLAAARWGSPLLVGWTAEATLVASDLSAIGDSARSIATLEDGDVAVLTPTSVVVTDSGRAVVERHFAAPLAFDDVADVEDHADYMHKEIFEQPAAVRRFLKAQNGAEFATMLNLSRRELRAFERVKLLGCGSSYYVGQIGAALIEELARIPADAEPASEFRYRNPVIQPDTLYVAVSQSGETADCRCGF